jgi:hypothetical protein
LESLQIQGIMRVGDSGVLRLHLNDLTHSMSHRSRRLTEHSGSGPVHVMAAIARRALICVEQVRTIVLAQLTYRERLCNSESSLLANPDKSQPKGFRSAESIAVTLSLAPIGSLQNLPLSRNSARLRKLPPLS